MNKPSKATWEPRSLPTFRFVMPPWLKDAHVDMNERYSSPPNVIFKVDGDPWPKGEPVLYEDEGEGAWTARSSDGYVMRRHYHSGHVSEYVAWRVMQGDEIVTKSNPDGWSIPTIGSGESRQQAAVREATKHVAFCNEHLVKSEGPPYRYETMDLLATEQQDGYGGRHFPIDLRDGRRLVLRGPWYGGPPVGWTDCFVFDVSDAYNAKPYVINGRHWPWYRRGGSFGYFFSDELVLAAVARFQPHVGVAMVYPGYGHARHEFYDLNWGAPKAFAEERKSGWGPAK